MLKYVCILMVAMFASCGGEDPTDNTTPRTTYGKCTPDNTTACTGKLCGTVKNNCGQTVSCGTCPNDQACTPQFTCCVTTCTWNNPAPGLIICSMGQPNGCGGYCPACPTGMACRIDRTCH